MKSSIYCTCGLNNKIFCKNCSKIRMIILLKNGQDHLKVNGFNPVWYSHLKYNRYDDWKIAEKMENNVRKHPQLAGAVNVLQFYPNGNRNHILKKVTL